MFIMSRGLIGFATVFPQVACPILVSELYYPTHRGKVTALYNTFFYSGAIAAAWITYRTFKMQSTWAFFFYDVAWTPLPQAYTIEIFPFLTRSRGLTTALTSSYIGLMSAQLINPVGLAALGWKYYVVFCCILACLVVVIYFLFPETKGRSLEQITELFEGRSVSVDAEEIISKGKVGVVYEIETGNKV